MSDTTVVILVVVAVLVLAAAGGYAWLRLRRRRQLAEMTPEEREFYEAKRQRDQGITLAEKTLKTTVDSWVEPVKAAESALAAARSIGSRPLGSFGKVRLFEDHIETPDGTFRFENGPVEAVVDAAGTLVRTKEAALSRADKQTFADLVARTNRPEGAQMLHLLIETPIFVSLHVLGSSDAADARQFSLAVNAAAGSVSSHAETRAAAVAQAQADLDRVLADKEAEVRSAQAEVEAVTVDTRRLDAATKAVEEATAPQPGSSPTPTDQP